MTLAEGTRLGPYEIVEPIGAGGMGEVYKARDTRIGRTVAIKILPADVEGDPDRRRRFHQEAVAAGALNHANLLVVHDVGREEGRPFLVTELLHGLTLRDLLRRGPLPKDRAVRYAAALLDGLAAAHAQGIGHRDVKPENIFITDADSVKILDFGLARLPDGFQWPRDSDGTATATAAGMMLGSVGYIPDGKALLFFESSEVAVTEYLVGVWRAGDAVPVRIGDGHATSLSADGKLAVAIMVSGPVRFRILPTGVSDAREVLTPAFAALHWVTWLPDGRHVLVSGNEPGRASRLYVVDLTGRVVRTIGPEARSTRATPCRRTDRGWRHRTPIAAW